MTVHFFVSKNLIEVNQNSSYPIKIFTLTRCDAIEEIKTRLVFVHVFINYASFFCNTQFNILKFIRHMMQSVVSPALRHFSFVLLWKTHRSYPELSTVLDLARCSNEELLNIHSLLNW